MIGLFFGDTDFPKLILKRLKKAKKKYLILDLSIKNIFKKDPKSFRVNIGQFGSILKLLRENKCNKVIFAGKIDKPNLSKLKLDITGIYYLPRIVKAYKKGDAAILKELINILALENSNTLANLDKTSSSLPLTQRMFSLFAISSRGSSSFLFIKDLTSSFSL